MRRLRNYWVNWFNENCPKYGHDPIDPVGPPSSGWTRFRTISITDTSYDPYVDGDDDDVGDSPIPTGPPVAEAPLERTADVELLALTVVRAVRIAGAAAKAAADAASGVIAKAAELVRAILGAK